MVQHIDDMANAVYKGNGVLRFLVSPLVMGSIWVRLAIGDNDLPKV